MQQAVSIQQENATRPAPVCPNCPLAVRPPSDSRRRQRDGGYMLLAILLLMAVMIVAATVEAPRLVQQMKRDREEEMIHRGTEYARAIKKFYKKFGRYPANLEQLDNTNQIRFLRKRYKDPLTKDGNWKLLNYGDIQLLLNTNTPGTPAAALGAQGQGAFGQRSAISSVGTTSATSSQQPNLNPGNIAYTSTQALIKAIRRRASSQPELPEALPECLLETLRKGTLSRAIILSRITSVWDRIACQTATSREARRRELIQPVAIRRLAGEPSSASPV